MNQLLLDNRRMIILMLALSEMESNIEGLLPHLAYVSNDKNALFTFLEHLTILEDCREMKEEFAQMIKKIG